MTIEEATATARAAFNAVNPHLDVPPQDFTVSPEVFDPIERYLVGMQGFVYAKPEAAGPHVDHLLWHGVRMIRGTHER